MPNQENPDNSPIEHEPHHLATWKTHQPTTGITITVPDSANSPPDGITRSVAYLLVQLLAYKQVSGELTQKLAAAGDEPGGDFTFVGMDKSDTLGLMRKDIKVMVESLSAVLPFLGYDRESFKTGAFVGEAITYAKAWLEHKSMDTIPVPGTTLDTFLALVASSNKETIQSRVASYKRHAEAATPFRFAK